METKTKRLEETQKVEHEAEEELPPLVRIENWEKDTAYRYGTLCLHGNVYGHPNLMEGELAYTSPVQWISEGAALAQTHSRLYALGKRKS